MFSCLDNDKMTNLIAELQLTKDVEGEIAEIGVYRGGSAQAISQQMPNKKLHLYDTFKGIVKSDKTIDIHSDGDFSGIDVEDIKKEMSKEVVFHVGTFPETFTEFDSKFSFVHSDTDTYFGTQETLKIFSNRMALGGKILFDDWKWHLCPGVEKAILEFLSNSKKYETKEYSNQFAITF
jgi:O-methyltransferase